MPSNYFEFEKPLIELNKKISDLKDFMDEKDVDLTDEIKTLENKAENLREEIYENLEPAQLLEIARHQERPTTRDYIKRISNTFVELHGDRRFGDDLALMGGIALIEEQPVTIIGHQKGQTTNENLKRNFGMAHPEGYRKAMRLMKEAEKFNRPVVSLINTPGAYPGIGAEERGQAEAIATNLMEMSDLKVPIITIVIGEGGSGGALGIGLGDKIMMFEYSYYSVCSPEACAAILWKDSDEASEAAKALSLTSKDLFKLGIIDKIIKEPVGGAHKDPDQAAKILKGEILSAIIELKDIDKEELIERRYNKFRKIGEYKRNKEKQD
ncbi:MAG: acetyl-CoA carboxylase carboxyltransferase subunit alpha [Bacillota bacterium]